MIRFILGFFTILTSVAAVESTVSMGVGILLAIIGTIIMVWGLSGMNERNLG